MADKRARIAIMSYSFESALKNPSKPDDPARTLDIMDLPQMYADRYGVHNVELQHSHLLSTEPAYLKDFLARVKKVKSKVTNINLELSTNMSSPTLYRRLEAVDLTKQWIDIAGRLGSPRVMLNQGSLTPEVFPYAVNALRTMGRYGDSKKVSVTLENRGATGWERVVEVVKAAGTYTNPDLGNFPDQATQLQALPAMFPFNRGNAHVKLRPERYDLATALQATKKLGYKGLLSIEATTNVSPDPYVATQKVLDVLLANL
jgi:sugar phosphate isomerase/epimerase